MKITYAVIKFLTVVSLISVGLGAIAFGEDCSVIRNESGQLCIGLHNPKSSALVLIKSFNSTNGQGKSLSQQKRFCEGDVLSDGSIASSPFETLDDYFSSFRDQEQRERIKGNFRIWQDRNRDGIFQASEIYRLQDLHLDVHISSLKKKNTFGLVSASECELGKREYDSKEGQLIFPAKSGISSKGLR